MDELLPLGSVISLAGEADQRFLVIGYYPEDDEGSYDYLLTLYPQGMFEIPYMVMVNNEIIESVCFKGFENDVSREMLSDMSVFMSEQAIMNAEIGKAILRYSTDNPEAFRSSINEFEENEQCKKKGFGQAYESIGNYPQRRTNDEALKELVNQGTISQEELDLIRDTYSETCDLIDGVANGSITGVSVGKSSALIVDDFLSWRIAETDDEITANQSKINKYDNLAKDYGIDHSSFRYSLEGKTCKVDLTENPSTPSVQQDSYIPSAGKYKASSQGSKTSNAASDEWHH